MINHRQLAECGARVRDHFGLNSELKSKGMCQFASVMTAVYAYHLGLPVNFVVWLVYPSKDYIDHWAVCVDFPRVVDVTYQQVLPGDQRLALDARYDYPANYNGPLIYPAEPLLNEGGGRLIAEGQLIPGGPKFKQYLVEKFYPIMSRYDGGLYWRWLCDHKKNDSVDHGRHTLNLP